MIIGNLQALRGFAALAVVVYHTGYEFNGAHTSFQGVSIFFVISGFLMTLITRRSATGFLRDRLIRIAPFYWLMTLIAVVWVGFALTNPIPLARTIAAVSQGGAAALWQLFGSYVYNTFSLEMVAHLIRSLLFLPFDSPLIGVGWTLNLEMFYYVVYWISLVGLGQRYAPVAAGSVLMLLHAMSVITGVSIFQFYGGAYTPFFVCGILVYYVWDRLAYLDLKPYRAWSVLLAAFVLAGLIGFSLTESDRLPQTSAFDLRNTSHFLFPTFVVLLALIAHEAGAVIKNPLLLLIGDASYCLYITHTLTMATIVNSVPDWLAPGSTVAGVLLAVLICSSISVFLHLWIEKPMLRKIRNLFKAAPRIDPAGGASGSRRAGSIIARPTPFDRRRPLS